MADETRFRITGDESVSITHAEIKAQQAAQRKLDADRKLAGTLRDVDTESLGSEARARTALYRQHGVDAQNVRHGMGDGTIRMPSDESYISAIEAGDMETAHLYKLQRLQPGTPEFMKSAQPGEEVIEVLGPKGAEGFGIVQRQIGTGPRAGQPLE